MVVRQSFKISFNNVELWNGCFDGLEQSYELIQKKFLEDIEVIKRPSSPSFVILNLYGTAVTDELAEFIIDNLFGVQSRIRKVVFSGLDRKSRNNIKQYIKKNSTSPQFLIGYFDDLQKAKEWLVSKG